MFVKLNLIFPFILLHSYTVKSICLSDSTIRSKKNTIEIKIGLMSGFVKNSQLNYHKEKNPMKSDEFYYDLNVSYKNEIHFPQIDINYNLLINRKKNTGINSSYISTGLGYSIINIKTIQKGEYEGGYIQTYFKGTINDEKRYSFINFAIGYTFDRKNINKTHYGFSAFVTPKYNFSTKRTHTEENSYISYFNTNYTNTTKNNIFNSASYKYSLVYEYSILAYISKEFKNINYGLFVGYVITNYSTANTPYNIFDFSFFKNYNLIKYGLTLKF